MRIVWNPGASTDREHIYQFIETDSPEAALRLDDLFSVAARSLADFPEKGRNGRKVGTRELIVHRNYILVYRIRDEAIEIVTILHAAQRWP